MTALALASKADVNRSRLSEFLREKDPTLPKDENLVAICKALPADHAARVAQAWVRERLGSTLSDAILAIGPTGGSGIDQLFSSLPTDAANAFRLLMEISREDADLRQSVVSLAAFAAPDEPQFQLTEIIGPDTGPKGSLIEKPTGDLIESPTCATPANSKSGSPGSSQPSNLADKTAGIVRLSPPQFVELGKKLPSLVAEETPKTKKKNKLDGTND